MEITRRTLLRAVLWEVAEDPSMSTIVRRGSVVARPEHAHAVHLTLRDLRPGREYWYRFSAGRWLSQIGRTRTAPAPWSMPEWLAMSFASCSQYEHGFLTAYRRMAEDEPDLVLHLGDYQYEYTANTYVAPGGNVRDHAGPETTDPATYRQRYAQYKSDPGRVGLLVDHLRRRRVGLAHRLPPVARRWSEPAPALPEQPAWLCADHDHPRGDDRRLPRPAVRVAPRCRGVHPASFAVYDREPGLDLTYDNQPAERQSRRFTQRMGDATIELETERP